MTSLAAGILIGGKGARLGGVAKGLLPGRNDVPIVLQLAREITQAAPRAQVFLLGTHPAYAHLPLPTLADAKADVGPIGGLRALLGTPSEEVILLGCDMPFVSAPLLRRLLDAPCRTAVTAKSACGHFEPLFSRFNVRATLPVVDRLMNEQRHSLQAVLAAVGAEALALAPSELAELRDWDTPEDIRAG